MDFKPFGSKQDPPIDIDSVASLIVRTQKEDGEIPWSEGDKTDPWDLVEAAMGLGIGGYHDEARRAFDWMALNQREDGSWYSSYRAGLPEDKTLDANMSSYIAVGVFHYYLLTGDILFLKKMWDMVSRAIEFALSLQGDEGQIYWSKSPEGEVSSTVLLTGSSSIYMSIKCAIAIADELGQKMLLWEESLERLGHAIRHKPHLFDMSKSRYSMDWFYPVLSGAVVGVDAKKRIDRHWKKFVITGQGVRCVSDRPWVTIAETSELILALSAMGKADLSKAVFNWIFDKRFEDGSYWCGFTFPDMVIWPEEKITWTNAVLLMAADAIYNLTPGGQIFSHRFWESFDSFSFNKYIMKDRARTLL